MKQEDVTKKIPSLEEEKEAAKKEDSKKITFNKKVYRRYSVGNGISYEFGL